MTTSPLPAVAQLPVNVDLAVSPEPCTTVVARAWVCPVTSGTTTRLPGLAVVLRGSGLGWAGPGPGRMVPAIATAPTMSPSTLSTAVSVSTTACVVQPPQAHVQAAELVREERLNRGAVRDGLGCRQALAQGVMPGSPPLGDEQDLLRGARELDDGRPLLTLGGEIDERQCRLCRRQSVPWPCITGGAGCSVVAGAMIGRSECQMTRSTPR